MSPASTQAFTVPPELSAAAPPEARGVPRDGVRLLVARPGRPLRHLVFSGLPGVLRRGDLLVVNDSDTEPAALDGHRADGRPVVLHVSGPTRRGGEWIVELRSPDGRRVGDGAAGEAVRLPGGVTAFLLAAHPDPHRHTGGRLWRARIPVAGGLPQWLATFGRPITYPYLRGPRPIDDYRTMFARRDGHGFASAEMPSAARPSPAWRSPRRPSSRAPRSAPAAAPRPPRGRRPRCATSAPRPPPRAGAARTARRA